MKSASLREVYPVISCGEDRHYIDHLERGLFVASSYAGSVLTSYTTIQTIPLPRIPAKMTMKGADWGGYRVIKDWGGTAPYTPEQYITWLNAWQPQWAATWDYPCGDILQEMAATPHPDAAQQQMWEQRIECRQNESTLMAWYFWHHYREVSWSWTPSVQGASIEDYRRHAQDLYPLIKRMLAYYISRDGEQHTFRVGVGSLVKRKAKMVRAILSAIAEELPFAEFHAWGLNYSMVNDTEALPAQVRSGDTSSYNGRFGRSIEQDKGRSEPQRKVVFQEKLPAYLNKIERALASPKQYASLFDSLEQSHENRRQEESA